MKAKTLIGVLLIVLGAISLAYEGINYTQRKTLFQVGSLKATTDQTKTIPLPPVFGGLALLAGAAVLTLGRRGEGV